MIVVKIISVPDREFVIVFSQMLPAGGAAYHFGNKSDSAPVELLTGMIGVNRQGDN
ncbi:MAG: hypothetical protein ACRD4K_05345 [Candidatus Acidiferrales bacterium]